MFQNDEFYGVIDELVDWLNETERAIKTTEPVDLAEDTVIIVDKFNKFKVYQYKFEISIVNNPKPFNSVIFNRPFFILCSPIRTCTRNWRGANHEWCRCSRQPTGYVRPTKKLAPRRAQLPPPLPNPIRPSSTLTQDCHTSGPGLQC